MRALVVGLALLIGGVGTAEAHQSATSRVHNIRHIAQSVWGETCDVGTMNVPIVVDPDGLRDEAGRQTGWSGRFSSAGYTEDGRYTGCRIDLDGRRVQQIGTQGLCVLLLHEFGHAAGLGHSSDPSNIMYPYSIPSFGPCEHASSLRRRARAYRRASAPSGTVILLPGGGWQSAHPATMTPWVDDFAAHGIRARAISYPLRNVTAAIDYVRSVVRAEPGPVVLYGISAGGTIAAALAAEGVAPAVNLVGPTDFTRWIGPVATDLMRKSSLDSYAAKRAASPFWRLRAGASPQLIQCGIADPITTIEQCTRYKDASIHFQADTRLDVLLNAHGQSGGDRAVARAWVATHLAK